MESKPTYRGIPVWYSALKRRSFKSLPYILHAGPAKRRSAVTLDAVDCILLAIYPGHSLVTASRSTAKGVKNRHQNERHMTVKKDIMNDEASWTGSSTNWFSAAPQLSTSRNILAVWSEWRC